MPIRLFLLLSICSLFSCQLPKKVTSLDPGKFDVQATVDERYQSFNVEMLEVTGGKFWRPYGPNLDAIIKAPNKNATYSSDTPSGMNPHLFQNLPPIDLKNSRLQLLTKALGPSYMRVSGTWANTTYLPAHGERPSKVPKGFKGILTRDQWKGVIDFSKNSDARIITSLATGMGTRDEYGVWTTEHAKRFFDYTHSLGGHIAAIEYMNEPNLAAMGGAPLDYNAQDFGKDFRIFLGFMKKTSADTIILGPGSVGETTRPQDMIYSTDTKVIKTEDMLKTMGPGIEAFSFHHYGALSKRCQAMGSQVRPSQALSEDWLARTDQTIAFYTSLRDKYAPRVPLWNTETADAACGGNPWAGTFLDTFRYLDQLGRSAQQGVKVVAHNTLVASDYGLLNQQDFSPKPNYWGALLWRKFMGSAVLDTTLTSKPGLHAYAHCLYQKPGGVAMLVINNDKKQISKLNISQASERYTLKADRLQSKTIKLNGRTLKLGKDDSLPSLKGIKVAAGEIEFAPKTITFLTFPEAGNVGCP